MRLTSLAPCALGLLLAGTLQAQPHTANAKGAGPAVYDFDVAHSSVGFSVKFMGVSTVRGGFADFDGTLVYDATRPERSTVTAIIQAASINTNSAMRDKDLKSANFFDAEKFPLITFRSTAARRARDGVVLEGPLTIHGVTKTVQFPVKIVHPAVKDAWENTRIGFIGTLRVNRNDFGVTGTKFWNSEFDPGRMSISDSVDIELMIEGEHANVLNWTAPRADSLIARADAQGAQLTADQFRAAAAASPPLAKASEVMLDRTGRKLLQRGRAADAVPFLKLGVELNPASAELLVWLARAQLAVGDAEAARVAAGQAMKVDPNSPAANELLRWLGPVKS